MWYYLIVMRKLEKTLAVISVIVVSLCAFSFFTVKAPAQPEQQTLIYSEASLLTQANKLRAEKGVPPLVLDERLNQSAQWKADDMQAFNYLGHVRDGYHGNAKGIELAPDCIAVNENYEYSTTSASPYDWWVTSPPHYTALINPKYDTTGFGYALVGDKHVYVQHFCDLK